MIDDGALLQAGCVKGYRAAIFDVVYLAAFAVNETVPDAARVKEMDLELLYKAADRHLLTGITAMALESAGVKERAENASKRVPCGYSNRTRHCRHKT